MPTVEELETRIEVLEGCLDKAICLPTAAQLSVDGALQAYVDNSLAETGLCFLPKGTIDINANNPLDVTQQQGCRIVGVGPYHSSHADWLASDRTHSTILESSDGTGIVWGAMLHSSLQNLCIKDADVGVLYPFRSGFEAAFNLLDRVSFVNCGKGFQAGESELQSDCADVVFRGCNFRDCDTGFQVLNQQGVNYIFEGLCNWHYCNVAIDIVEGGDVVVRDCTTYGGNTFMRTGAGVSYGAMPLVIDRVIFDRDIDPVTPGNSDPFPVIFDGSATVNGDLAVDIKNVRVATQSGEPDLGHHCFRMPANADPPTATKYITTINTVAQVDIMDVEYV